MDVERPPFVDHFRRETMAFPHRFACLPEIFYGFYGFPMIFTEFVQIP